MTMRSQVPAMRFSRALCTCGAITVIEDGWVLAEHAGSQQAERTTLLRGRDVHDYAFTDWIYGPTALTPDQEPPMYQAISLASVGTSPN